MVNLAVGYWRADGASDSLFSDVKAWVGSRAQNKGFVAGSMATTWNITSHNADNQGISHAVDIGVDIENDGSGLLLGQAQWLAEHLRALGRVDHNAGRPGRLAYIIYNRGIAGDHTNWNWMGYTGSSPHLDHIHVSTTFDYHWGDPVWGTPQGVWDDRSSWGIAGGGSLSPATGGSLAPIPTAPIRTADEQFFIDLSIPLP